MDSTGRVGDNSVLGMDGECTRLDETVSDTVSSDTRLATFLVGRDLSVVFGNFFLN